MKRPVLTSVIFAGIIMTSSAFAQDGGYASAQDMEAQEEMALDDFVEAGEENIAPPDQAPEIDEGEASGTIGEQAGETADAFEDVMDEPAIEMETEGFLADENMEENIIDEGLAADDMTLDETTDIMIEENIVDDGALDSVADDEEMSAEESWPEEESGESEPEEKIDTQSKKNDGYEDKRTRKRWWGRPY